MLATWGHICATVSKVIGGGLPVDPLDSLIALVAGTETSLVDFTDQGQLFQDGAGTIPVTAQGQPIGRALDLSGNGFHLVQTTGSRKPLYSGNDGAGFDGANDRIDATYAASFNRSLMLLLRKDSGSFGPNHILQNNIVYEDGSNVGTPYPTFVDQIETLRREDLHDALDDGAYHEVLIEGFPSSAVAIGRSGGQAMLAEVRAAVYLREQDFPSNLPEVKAAVRNWFGTF